MNGAFSLPVAVAGLALIESHGLDLMKAEIDRLLVLPRAAMTLLLFRFGYSSVLDVFPLVWLQGQPDHDSPVLMRSSC
jgi:hypothetical protein